MNNEQFNTDLKQKAKLVNTLLADLLNTKIASDNDLRKPMLYTLEAGGKRLRPAIILWSCQAVSDRTNRAAEIAAAAIEMVHTYSLVHDDLPAMDNDDLRRGRPTCHKAFDEATAILTGDALLTAAFEILASFVNDPAIAVKLVNELAKASGPAGMIAGQIADLKAEKGVHTPELLKYIHNNKTARMFEAAAVMGGIAAAATDPQLESLRQFGRKLGLGFQIADDILDVSATSEQLGKTAGKDVKAGKLTYPALFGMEESLKLEKQLADDAVNALSPFGPEADTLRHLATVLVKRKK